MKAKQRSSVIYLCVTGLLVISFFVSGCGPGQLLGPTLTPTPTNTSTPTNTPTPTTTPTTTPTITPAPTATNTPSPTPLPGLGWHAQILKKRLQASGILLKIGRLLMDNRCAESPPPINGITWKWLETPMLCPAHPGFGCRTETTKRTI